MVLSSSNAPGGQLFLLGLAMHGLRCWIACYVFYCTMPLCFFLCFRRARAKDLGSALPKKHVFFSAQRAHWIVADFQKIKKTFRIKAKLFEEIKNIFPAVFFACFFRRAH